MLTDQRRRHRRRRRPGTCPARPSSSTPASATAPVDCWACTPSRPPATERHDRRDTQLGAVAAWLEGGGPAPSIAFGDFNVTYYSPELQPLLDDTGARSSQLGFGLQATWPVQFRPAGIAIDQSIYTGALTAVAPPPRPELRLRAPHADRHLRPRRPSRDRRSAEVSAAAASRGVSPRTRCPAASQLLRYRLDDAELAGQAPHLAERDHGLVRACRDRRRRPRARPRPGWRTARSARAAASSSSGPSRRGSSASPRPAPGDSHPLEPGHLLLEVVAGEREVPGLLGDVVAHDAPRGAGAARGPIAASRAARGRSDPRRRARTGRTARGTGAPSVTMPARRCAPPRAARRRRSPTRFTNSWNISECCASSMTSW